MDSTAKLNTFSKRSCMNNVEGLSEYVWIGIYASLGYIAKGVGLTAMLVLLCCLVAAVAFAMRAISVRVRSRKSRAMGPQEGQVWIQDGKERLYITTVYENGMIGISSVPQGRSCTHSFWSELATTFEARKRNRHLILLRQP